jgi:solute carrier family 50 (sugar transporter)
MVSAETLILEYICPGAGVIIATIMFAAPLLDVKRATLSATLGDLNPTPWVFMLGNCIGWIAYGILNRNWFVFWGNVPGFFIACWLNLQACKLRFQEFHAKQVRQSILTALEEESHAFSLASSELPLRQESPNMIDYAKIVWNVTAQKTPAPAAQENLVLFIIAFWTAVIGVITMFDFDQKTRESIVGYSVISNLLFFYGAPLSTIFTVIKTRRCNSIHVPTMLTNTFNGALWCSYAVAVSDPFIAGPNGIGILLGVIQMSLCVLYPRKKDTPTVCKGEMHSESNQTAEVGVANLSDGSSSSLGNGDAGELEKHPTPSMDGASNEVAERV